MEKDITIKEAVTATIEDIAFYLLNLTVTNIESSKE